MRGGKTDRRFSYLEIDSYKPVLRSIKHWIATGELEMPCDKPMKPSKQPKPKNTKPPKPPAPRKQKSKSGKKK